ncbi:MAG: hypothetical protein EOP21_09215, partial [Hyphomicrobiales bacterium]
MSPTEPAFLFLFLPAFLALFALGGKLGGGRAALAVLVVASLFISGTHGCWFFVLAAASTAANYALLLAILKLEGRARGIMLAAGVAINIGLLALVKYTIWLQWIPAVGLVSLALSNLVPVSLSFLTFQRSVGLLDGVDQAKRVRSGLF